MGALMRQSASSVVADPLVRPRLRLFRPTSSATALGLAVNHLMTKPAFANQRFGEWSKILVGQINRNHYRFVLDDKDRVVGFIGWALTSADKAEAWVEGRGGFSDVDAKDGNCVVFNAWSADEPGVNVILLGAAREAMRGRDMMYFKRLYKDGSVRPVRMRVNEFVARHLERALNE
jgi:hemolysin-activating ACP:hemolysin acyltransferase